MATKTEILMLLVALTTLLFMLPLAIAYANSIPCGAWLLGPMGALG
jgi:hypothetical protein